MNLTEAKQILKNNGFILNENDISKYWNEGGEYVNEQLENDADFTKEFLAKYGVKEVKTYADAVDFDEDSVSWKCYLEIFIPKAKIKGMTDEEISDKIELPLLDKMLSDITYQDSDYKETDEFYIIEEIGTYLHSL